MNNTQTGLAGEFYTLAQLCARGFIATLTLGNTKGVDILVTNQEINKLFKVEVKTSTIKESYSRIFEDGITYDWMMNKKHETMIQDNLIFCFVHLADNDHLPKFYLVPSKDVAKQVRQSHQFWLKRRNVKDTSIRTFRIHLDNRNGYENNWNVFE